MSVVPARGAAMALLGRGSVLPAILAPMYRVSGPELVIAGCRAGLLSAFAAQTPDSLDRLTGWIAIIRRAVGDAGEGAAAVAGWGVSMVAHSGYRRFEAELDLVAEARPAFVVTALGSPRRVVDRVQGYGGLVLADVNSVTLARKAADAGADGLVLVCAGAGGQTGSANPFGFVAEVRRFFDGVIVLAGGIASGQAIRAAELMGADLAYVGTAFIPTPQSLADPAHKQGVAEAGLDDIVTTAAVTGVPATFTRSSLIAAGFDPDDRAARAVDFTRAFDGAPRARAYAAGHGVGLAVADADVAAVADRLRREYRMACARPGYGAGHR